MVSPERPAGNAPRGVEGVNCPTFESRPWVEGGPLSKRRVAIISMAGLHRPKTDPLPGTQAITTGLSRATLNRATL